MSSEIIPLKGRTDFQGAAEFQPRSLGLVPRSRQDCLRGRWSSKGQYGEPPIEKLWFRNWVCVLGQTRGRAYTPWTAPLAGSKPAPTLSRQPRPHHLAGFSLSQRLPSLA